MSGNSIVHAWYNYDIANTATKKGYKVIRSYSWYLD